jgi:hypothetical protein
MTQFFDIRREIDSKFTMQKHGKNNLSNSIT